MFVFIFRIQVQEKLNFFLEKEVSEFCDLKLIYKIGCEGFQRKKFRDIWVFQKLN